MPVHGAADVEEQQHLYGIAALGTHQDIEIAPVRRMFDGAVKVELFGRSGSRKLAQAPQRNLDVAGAELDVVVEVLEFTPLPDLDRMKIAIGALTNAHAFWVVAKRAERRGSGGADPFAAAL